MREIVIRGMTEAEYPLLIGFLYEAIFVRQDETPPPILTMCRYMIQQDVALDPR